MASVDDAYDGVPVEFYTHNPQRGETLHRSEPQSIRRELTALQVPDGARVLEIGTGSGYSGAMLAELVGPTGRVISVDVSEHLVGWANLLHDQRGITTVTCHLTDGSRGYPAHAFYDRIVSWCAFPRLPQAWIDQLAPDGRIVACLPVTAQPATTLITTITLDTRRQPHVAATTFGGYAQSSPAAVDDALTIPGRWIDWSIRRPQPSWISIAWRDADDRLRTGARTTLDRLLHPGHTETSATAPLDWHSWNVYTAVIGGPNRTVAALPQGRGVGHSTPSSAALILTDATIVADSPTSPSLTALRTWLDWWEQAGRPAANGPDAEPDRQRQPRLPRVGPAGDRRPGDRAEITPMTNALGPGLAVSCVGMCSTSRSGSRSRIACCPTTASSGWAARTTEHEHGQPPTDASSSILTRNAVWPTPTPRIPAAVERSTSTKVDGFRPPDQERCVPRSCRSGAH